MYNKHYRLPLQFSTILSKKAHPLCENIGESIAQNIHLFILTSFNEHRFNNNFGCTLWESDFSVVPDVSNWQSNISKSLGDSIEKHERRLRNIKVKVNIDQEEFIDPLDQKAKRIKKRIKIEVTGNLKRTDEKFGFSDIIYFSPVSLD